MENAVINLSICLSDLPKEKIQKAKNGKLYININIRKRKEPDQFGQDVYATVQQTKEEKEAKTDKLYVGNGKYVKFDAPGTGEMVKPKEEDIDGLPF